MTKNNEPEHGSLVSRSSIDSRFQWNINDIYPDQESWKTASQQFKKDVDAFSQYKGQLHDCQTLKTVLREQEKLSIIISKLYAYARLQQDTDNANQQFQALVGEAEALAAAFSNAVSFVEPELLSLSQEKLNDLLSDSDFSDYRFYLNNLLRLSKHVLPKEQEELLQLNKTIEQIRTILTTYGEKLKNKEKLDQGKIQYIEQLMRAFKEKEAQRTPLEHEYERLQSILNGSSNARVKVSKTLYAGVIVNITDVSLIVKDDRSFCQLYKDEGEVKISNM